MKPWEVDQLTPNELSVMVEVFCDNLINKRNENLFLAWHIEALARIEKLPKLSSLQSTPENEVKVQTPGQQLEQIKILNALFGGVVNEC